MKDRAPLLLRLQTHEIFNIEKSRMVGPVIRAAGLAGAFGRLRKGAQQDSRPIRDRDAFVGSCALLKGPAHPERAFIQMGKKFCADHAAECEIDSDKEADNTNTDRESLSDG